LAGTAKSVCQFNSNLSVAKQQFRLLDLAKANLIITIIQKFKKKIRIIKNKAILIASRVVLGYSS